MKKFFAVLLLFTFTASVVFGWGALSQSYYKYAKKAEQKGDYATAIKYYKKILKIDPNEANIYWALAKIAEKQGNFDEAINWYEKSLQAEPTCYAYVKLGTYYLKKAETLSGDQKTAYKEKAKEAYEKALTTAGKRESKQALSANREYAEYNLSIIYYELGEYDKAEQAALEAMKNKQFQDAMLGQLLNIYTKTNNFAKAIQTIDEKLKNDPNNIALLKLKINVLNKMGKKQQVIDLMKKISNMGAKDPEILSWLAQDALNHNQYQKSYDLFKKLLDSGNDNYKITAYLGMGKNLILMGKKKEGLVYMKKAEQINPADPKVLTFIADAYVDAKQYDNAINYYRRVLMLKQNDYTIYLNLANAYQTKNPPNYQKAIKYFLIANKLAPRSIYPKMGLFYAYFNSKQFKKAYYWGKKVLKQKYDKNIKRYMNIIEKSGELNK